MGDYYNSDSADVVFTERLSGATWTLVTAPDPAGAQGTELEGISCTAANACEAVGDSINSSGTDLVYAEHFNGSKWSLQTVPSPAGATGSYFAAVSCSSSSACTAVGSYTTSTGATAMLAERWTGTSWTISTTAAPGGATASELNGISCRASTPCQAVGDYTSKAGVQLPLAEAWNGSAWSESSPPLPSGAQARGAVRCLLRRGERLLIGRHLLHQRRQAANAGRRSTAPAGR